MSICNAGDRIGERELTLAERYNLAVRAETGKYCRRKDLPEAIELAKGMKFLVTDNVATDLDTTSGTRGEIVERL